MIKVEVKKDVALEAARVWALLRDFGDISWSGMDNVEVEGSGVGMIRRIIVGEGQFAEERLEAYDEEGMTFTYAILTDSGMPVTGIRGTPRVRPIDDSSCELSWTVIGEPIGVPPAEAEATLVGFYTGLLDVVAGAAQAQV